MAKKTSAAASKKKPVTKKAPVAKKKPAKRPPPAASKKKAKKAQRPAAPARRTGRGAPAQNPTPVSTGSGPGPAQIGADLVSMFNLGQFTEIEKKWWSPEIVSVEGVGVAMAWRGRGAVEAKGREWYEKNIIHGASAEGPYVGASGFAVKFRMDVEERASGSRGTMEEVGVYTVQDGKIVREEFMYGATV